MANKSQTTIGLVSISVTLDGNWQKVADQDANRAALLMMNTQANDIAVYFHPMIAAGAPYVPPTGAAGDADIYVLAATGAGKQGGSYEPDAGFIPGNAIYVKGTASQKFVGHVSQPPSS